MLEAISRHSARLLLAALVITNLLAVGVLGALSERALATIASQAARELSIERDALQAAHQLRLATERHITHTRGYLLAIAGAGEDPAPWVDPGDPAFLAPTLDEALVAHDAEDARILAEIARLRRAYADYAVRLLALRRAGDDAGLAREMAAGAPLLEQLRENLDGLIARHGVHLDALRAAMQATRERQRRDLMLVLLAATAAALALTVGRRFLRPLADLVATTRLIGEGQLAARVPVRVADEFGEAAEAFNRMATRVEGDIEALQHLTAELRAADRHKDEFLSVVSHELRTPLNGILGFAGILEDELDGPLSEVQRARVAAIVAAGERLDRIIGDLLAFARIRAGRLALTRAAVSPLELLGAVAEVRRAEARARGVELVVEADAAGLASVDDARVADALDRLLDNAIKFSPPGGEVALSAAFQGEALVLEVRDRGPGLPEGVREKAFERFRQGDMSATREVGGLGLGLAIVRAIAEAHGGRAEALARPGGGALFRLTLPGARALAPEGVA